MSFNGKTMGSKLMNLRSSRSAGANVDAYSNFLRIKLLTCTPKNARLENFNKELSIISCKILSGKEPATRIKEIVREELSERAIPPRLVVVMIGNNPASQAYVNGKKKDCEECGINFELIHLSEKSTQEDVISLIARLNASEIVDGILVQLPIPAHLDKETITKAIDPCKDVDCFCERNLGRLFLNRPTFEPCTPAGVFDLLDYYAIDLKGKHCVVIGRSDIVGKPLAVMLINAGATVTVCNSHTKELQSFTEQADIVISAVGKPRFLTANMFKEGAIVIDVGINRDENGKMCGDVDFEGAKEKVSAITPVPGGVGLMTRAALMKNLVKANKKNS